GGQIAAAVVKDVGNREVVGKRGPHQCKSGCSDGHPGRNSSSPGGLGQPIAGDSDRMLAQRKHSGKEAVRAQNESEQQGETSKLGHWEFCSAGRNGGLHLQCRRHLYLRKHPSTGGKTMEQKTNFREFMISSALLYRAMPFPIAISRADIAPQ